MTQFISPHTAHAWLFDGQEIALLDVREAGQFGEGHPFLAIALPFSRLELEIRRLVPRTGTRIVLLDQGDAVAASAAQRLQQLGYTQVHVLQGGAPGWAQAGYTLFQGVNLPSKTFGELVEHAFATPHISAQTLHAWQNRQQALLLWDGRTPAEHRKMTIPGSRALPNGELPLHWQTLAPDPQTPIVIHCAGRTRSIVGAQMLRSLGIPNPVYALENGTQGWALQGLPLEHGSPRDVLPPPPPTVLQQQQAAQRLAQANAVPTLSTTEAQAWIDDTSRNFFLLDVRTAQEFAQGTLAGAQHAPGGQLLQATDQYVGVRGARLIVLDHEGVRAPVIAAWLRMLGHEAAILAHGIHTPLHTRAAAAASPVPTSAPLTPPALQAWLQTTHSVVLDARSSTAFRQAHPQGARWTIRPRLPQALHRVAPPHGVLFIASQADSAALLLHDAQAAGIQRCAWTLWEHWQQAGLPVVHQDSTLSDADAIDYLFFVHDRHDGNLEAARQYLAWETGLIAQCSPQELGIFRLPANTSTTA